MTQPEPPRPRRGRPVEVQDVLLVLGTLLVAVAVTVFVAINWQRIDAVGQGLILLAITATLGVATLRAARKGLQATAEACGLVTVLLALGDVHALRVGLAPNAPVEAVWAGGLAAVAAASWGLGRVAKVRSSVAASTVLAQAACLTATAALGVRGDEVPTAALVISGAAVVGLARMREGGRFVRRVGLAYAALVAVGATVGAFGNLVFAWLDDAFADAFDREHAASVVGLVAGQLALSAVFAGVVAKTFARRDGVREVSMVAGTALGIVAATVLGTGWSGDAAVATAALSSALAFSLARFVPTPWRRGPAAVSAVAFAVASIPLVSAVSASLVAASEVVARAWLLSSSAPASRYATHGIAGGAEIWLHVAAAASVAISWSVTRRRVHEGGLPSGSFAFGSTVLASIAGVATMAAIVAPVASALTVAGATYLALGLGLAFAGGAALAPAAWSRRIAAGFALVASVWALAWGAATPELTILVLGASAVSALVVAAVAHHRDDEVVAASAAGWLQVGVPATVGLVLASSGVDGPWCWAAAGIASAIVGLVGVLLVEPDGTRVGVDGAIARVAEVGGAIVHAVTLLALAEWNDLGALAAVFAAGAIAMGLHSVRPDRRHLAAAAAVEGLGSLWIVLHLHDVALVEAYTLPVALLLGVLGATIGRTRAVGPVPSWMVEGPALVVGLAPTVVLAIAEGGAVRPLVGIVAGAALVVVGAATRRRAPFDVGAVTVVALGLQQAVPVVGHLPNWATIGATGLALIGVGATFEQRRQDLRVARRRYASLG